MIKSALGIYNRLLEAGEVSMKHDSELFMEYKKDEVRALLSQFEGELGFKILDAGNTVYMIPNLDNDVLAYVMREFRESIASNARMVDAYLQIYICMVIFYLFYGGKNTNPIQREFIQMKDLVAAIDQRMEKCLGDMETTEELEAQYSMNFSKIAELWMSKQIGEMRKTSTKLGMLSKTCTLLEKEKLLRILQEGQEIRRTQKLDDLFLYYYLDENRVQEIHGLFRGEF